MKYRISDVASINESSISKSTYIGSVNYVDTSSVISGNFNGYRHYPSISEAPSRARRLVSKEDTVISTVRPNMKHVGFISSKSDCIYSTGFAVVSPKKDKIDPYYLYLFLSSNRVTEVLQSIGETSTSTYPSVKPSDIGNLVIDMPPLDEQHLIANRIRLIDEKKNQNSQINANLFKLAKIHFDRQLDSENIKFSQISTIQNGYAFKSKEYVDTNELMILRTKNINDNHLFSKNDVVYISKELFDEYKKFSFSAFDTVLVMVGASIGKTGFVTSNMTPSLQNQNMWRFRPKMSNIPGLLIFQYVNYINKHVIGSATGSARSFYRKKLFSEFEVPRINSTNYIYFDTLQREIDHLNTENEILYRIKHSLLNHYF